MDLRPSWVGSSGLWGKDNFSFKRTQNKTWSVFCYMMSNSKPTHSYLRWWEKPDRKLFQPRWRLCRCTHRCQSWKSPWHTAQPCCSWSWHRICQSHRVHCCPCTKWPSVAGNQTPDPPSSLSYPQNPSWTRRASWWSLEGLCALLVGKKVKKIRSCYDIGKWFEI